MIKQLYGSPEWIAIRNSILERDNFTCQKCKDFNPELGAVQIMREDDTYIELHEYESSPVHSLYKITSQKTELTVEIEFGIDWLVLPVMQVHHKRYIKGRQPWKYDHSDLVTLCKACHTKIHLQEEIPFYSELNEFLYTKKLKPEDYGNGRKHHNYKPWIFIKQDAKQKTYKVTSVNPQIHYIVLGHKCPDQIAKTAHAMITDFFDKHLPDYKPKKQNFN